MKKILLLKSLESFYDMDYTGGIEPLNPLSLALTKKFLPKWSDSPLKTEIMNRFHCLPCLRLGLDAQCEQGSDIISALSLQVEEYDLERGYWRGKAIDADELNSMAETFFRSIGYPKIVCLGTDEIEMFIAKLAEDVSLVNEYFKIVEIADEEELEWYWYHSNPYHNPNRIWSISIDYGGTILRGEIINYDKSSITVMMTNPAVDLRMRDGRSHLIWGNEGKEIAHQLLIDLFHAYQNINDNIDVIREKYKELSEEYVNYERLIDETNDIEKREALEFEKRNFFKQAFREIIGYKVENIESFLITNKLIE